MRLISCDSCAVVLDSDKLTWPEIWDDDGCLIDKLAMWDGETYIPVISCPVCGTHIPKQ